MRILTLSNVPLDESLGSGYVVLGYARGLRARGHRVDVLGPADYEPLYGWRRAISYRQAVGMAVESARRLALADYDVIEYYGGEAWLAVSALARLPGRRFLLVCHSNGLETHCAEVLRGIAGPHRRRRRFQFDQVSLSAGAFTGADALVTVAEYDREFALRRGYVPSDRVLAIDNPLPDSYLGIGVDLTRGPVIGYCGTWVERKATALIQADLPPLLRAFPAWSLVLVGVGAGFRAEQHFPRDLLPRITVVPHAERDSGLRALYQSFAISILPSYYESFGLAASEAMACGCALVASRAGFGASLRHGEEALLLQDAAPPALYQALRALIEDPRQRLAIARAGWQRVQSLRWDGAIAQLEAAYLRWLTELRQTGY